MSEKQRSRLDKIVNLGLLIVIGFLLVGPQSYLRTAFDAWRAKVRISNLVEENWENLAATTSRMHTVDTGPVWLVEFGDYECPFCRRAHPVLEKLAAQNPHVTIGYRHYPLRDTHPKAEGAARASICAEKQGRFQQMHSLLMTTTDWSETGDWVAVAEQATAPDLAAFRECLSDEVVGKRLEEDKRLGDALGVTVTPTFFYQFGMQRGYLDEDQLTELLHAVTVDQMP